MSHETKIDYYALLAVPRDASQEEISKSYHKLAKTFHPDKIKNISQRREAEQRFNDLKEAFDVLTDDGKRKIYDIYGVAGIKSSKELGAKLRTPEEFLRFFDKERQKQEDEYVENRVHLRGNIVTNISLTDLTDVVTGKRNLPEVAGMTIGEKVKIPFSDKNIATVDAQITAVNGNGNGSVWTHFRRVFDPNTFGFFNFGTNLYNRLVQIGGWRKLDTSSEAYLTFSWRNPGTDMDLLALRRITPYTNLIWGWTQGVNSNMRAGFSTITETDNYSALIEARPKQVSLTCTARHDLSKKAYTTASLRIASNGFSLSYGIAHQITDLSKVILGFSLGTQGGLVLTFGFSRLGQRFSFPLLLTREVNPLNSLFGILAHATITILVKSLIIDPIRSRRKLAKLEGIRKSSENTINEQKEKAQSFIRLMESSVARKRAQEEEKGGLIIQHASYGKLPQSPEKPEDLNNMEDDEENPFVIDVTIPVQYMVENSQLHLHPGPKSGLVGFYDPCPGEEKFLEVIYLFKNKLHRICISDEEHLRIPIQSHAWGWTPSNNQKT